MIFSSLEFVCVFLPVVFLVYTVLPSLRVRNAILIVASILFYAYGEPVYVILMLGSSLLNYCCALLAAGKGKRLRQSGLVLAVVVNLGVLCVFKYTGFLVGTVNSLFGLGILVPQIELPVGISFFTFQALSYVIDVYAGKVEVQRNFFRVLLYISFFPQLIAGPIVKYRDIAQAIDSRRQDVKVIAEGFRRFVCGLGKKLLIANTMGYAADQIFAADVGTLNILAAWLGAAAYMLQIYYDFSGYSDMAIGLGGMFGFTIRENFRYPYGAAGIQDFWRKWHISLSGWFKEYLYIPLGGNRKGKARAAVNRLIVFFFTGLWHGANWTFVVWGIYHGMFLLLEEYVPAIRKLPKALLHIYTLLVVCVGFVIFRADDMGQALLMIRQMFCGFTFDAASMSLLAQQLTPFFLVMLAAGIFGAAPVALIVERLRGRALPQEKGKGMLSGGALPQENDRRMLAGGTTKDAARYHSCAEVILYACTVALLMWCMVRMSGSTYNPFIYFRF